ncbi:hypothetical protein PTSG_01098 [Salpingoeca rosetta]|uniref:Uncharacterized protein n=1 Tax=Salpingoeca rosetta (strain ATCC 50818 / BSB-021) TaxID=946362 RepID=F2U0T3_SALR5|nr:uncharacterized protein PTSG_01098 [Salpingoeca rosetta]EGD80507.1 hypothetical protein PTSG_01098 [Salpingoeca rosetta]|eukprot:XP_004997068.1 hypothetical protein PTSG_01098 [Salpingoeca rosetta]
MGDTEKSEKPRRERRERRTADADEAAENPFGAYMQSENVLDKLKLLKYEQDFCKKFSMKPIHRYYFAESTDPNEQLWYFANLVSWLLSFLKQRYKAPDQYDDPNSIVTSVMMELRKAGVSVDVSQSKLKTGAGEEICQILNQLGQMALKSLKWTWGKPIHKHEDFQEQEDEEEAVEITTADMEAEEEIEEEDFDDEADAFIDGGAMAAEVAPSSERAEVLESNVTAAEWKIELERVLPQLKVHIRSDAKDWRTHLQQMQDNKTQIEGALKDTTQHLSKLEKDIAKTLEKIMSREKYINGQLETLVSEFRQQQDSLAATQERYKQASTTVTEYSRQLAAVSADLEAVKSQMDERGSSMTDASPLVKIKQALKALKTEISQMDLRIGVIQHVLLAAKVRQKGEIVQDMNADTSANNPFAVSDDDSAWP